MPVILYHSGKVDILGSLHRPDYGSNCFELAFAAVNEDDIGILESVVFVMCKTPLKSLSHGLVIVL